MDRRWKRLTLTAAAALALPAALAALASGSCSLVYLYDGANDAAAGGTGAGSSSSASSSGAGGGRDGGSDGDADADVDDGARCPVDMVQINTGGDAGYCIDRTEVTNMAYGHFLAVFDAAGPQEPPGKCDWNVSYAPLVPVDAGDLLPVLGVDWCDAYAYCLSLGRHLCGAVGTGPIAPGLQNEDKSEWFRACSNGANKPYPYSTTNNPQFNIAACADCNPDAGCNLDASPPTSAPVPVGSKKNCVGGYAGLYDMSGNAAEWEDGCDGGGVDAAFDLCFHRGGSFYESTPEEDCLACSTLGCPYAGDLRSHRGHNIGLRCCLDF